jgi:hypothetical protein
MERSVVLDTSAGPNSSTTGPDGISTAVTIVLASGASVARTVRRHRAVALRAGAGAAMLLGVTAAVDTVVNLGAGPAPAQALADPSSATRRSGPAAAGGGLARVAVIADQAQAVRREAQAAARTAGATAARAHRTARQQEASRSAVRGPRSAAQAMLAARGRSGQFGCLDALWQRESGWHAWAYNASSGAFGIPQALPGDKMASAGADWRTNPVTQIRWGLDYIASRYGTPCGAWGHSQAYGWY